MKNISENIFKFYCLQKPAVSDDVNAINSDACPFSLRNVPKFYIYSTITVGVEMRITVILFECSVLSQEDFVFVPVWLSFMCVSVSLCDGLVYSHDKIVY